MHFENVVYAVGIGESIELSMLEPGVSSSGHNKVAPTNGRRPVRHGDAFESPEAHSYAMKQHS